MNRDMESTSPVCGWCKKISPGVSEGVLHAMFHEMTSCMTAINRTRVSLGGTRRTGEVARSLACGDRDAVAMGIDNGGLTRERASNSDNERQKRRQH
jgi:hypothetical protein